MNSWKEGTNQLSETLKICRDAGVASPLVSSAVVASTGALSEGATDADGDEDTLTSSAMMPPPRKLMALPPLGRLVNACLVGLNELRRCLLPGVFSQLREAIEKEFLLETKNILHTHERAVMTPGMKGDVAKLREIAKEMKMVTKTIVFPYVRGAVELSLGNEEGAQQHFDKLRKVLNPPAPPAPVPTPEPTTAAEGDAAGDETKAPAGEPSATETPPPGTDADVANPEPVTPEPATPEPQP